MNFKKYYAVIMEQYPEYVNKEQMCEICGISKKTAYNLEHSGKIPYTVEVNRLIHTHRIKLIDILTYLYEKECRQESDSAYILSMREFYTRQFANYPDVVTVRNVERMTGFSTSGILNWIQRKRLRALTVKKGFLVPKICLIDFLVSPYYRRIKNKTEKQKKDLWLFELWYTDHANEGGATIDGAETRVHKTIKAIS